MNTIPSAIFAIALVIMALIGAHTVGTVVAKNDTISVTGKAEHNFEADLIQWRVIFQRLAPTTQEGYRQLKQDARTVKAYLQSKGVKEEEMVLSSVESYENYSTVYNEAKGETVQIPQGMRVSQAIIIKSTDIDRIATVSREVTDLLEQGIDLASANPEYLYTKLSDLKLKLIADATADGYKRAVKIADNSAADVARLRSAKLGVFQITAENSTDEYSGGGAFDTSSRRKTASITIKLDYGID